MHEFHSLNTNLPPQGARIRIQNVKPLLLFLITATLPALDWAPLEKMLQEEMASQKIPGAAIVVIQHGKPVIVKGYGVRSAEDPIPVTEKTLFRLGSTAKIFTALAAARLAEQGRLDLQAPIGGPPLLAKVTMHQLLSHTAGLADEAPQNGPHDESAMQQNVSGYDQSYVLAPPGKFFSYANTGYVVAGYTIEKLTGKPFADAMRDLVFAPYEMHASTYRPLEAILHPLALPHDPSGKLIRPFPDHAGSWPPGSLFSNAEDLARFLSRGLPELLTRPQSAIAATGQQYGYGAILEDGRIFHTGARLGYGSRFEIFPEHGVAVFLIGNRTGAIFSRTSAMLRSQLAKPGPPKQRHNMPLSTTESEALAGVYLNRNPIRTELVFSSGALYLKAGGRQIPIQKLGDNQYRAPGGAQMEQFRTVNDSAGKPEYLCAEVWCLKKQ